MALEQYTETRVDSRILRTLQVTSVPMSQFAITTHAPVGVGTSRSNIRPRSRPKIKAMLNAPIDWNDYSAALTEPRPLPVGTGRSNRQDRLLVTKHLQDDNRQLEIFKATTRAGTTTTTQTITTTYKDGVTPVTRRISSSVRKEKS